MRSKRSLVGLFSLICLSTTMSAALSEETTEGTKREFIVGVKTEETSPPKARALITAYISQLGFSARKIDPIGHTALIQATPQEASDLMNGTHPDIVFIEENQRIKVNLAANDPLFKDFQWNLKSQSGINATSAWDITQGSEDTIVAVLDTGFTATHPDIDERLFRNPKEIPSNGIDDDGNGRVDDMSGYNFFEDNVSLVDEVGHGTAVASVIAAEGNNYEGISGVSWRSKILPLKVSRTEDGYLDLNDIAAAFQYIADLKRRGHNIVAANCSFGGSTPTATMENAVRAATEAGIVVVTSAGNGQPTASGLVGYDIDKFPLYPASYAASIPGVVSVAATNQGLKLAGFSNFGVRSVTLGAPGEGIPAAFRPTYIDGQVFSYLAMDGTSLAAPHVAGTIALMQSVKKLEMLQVIDILKQTTRPIDALLGFTQTNGMVDAGAAVRAARDFKRTFTVTPVVTYLGTALSTVRISITGRADGATDAFGKLAIRDISEGTTLTITPSLDGFTFSPASLTITPSSSTEVQFTAEKKPIVVPTAVPTAVPTVVPTSAPTVTPSPTQPPFNNSDDQSSSGTAPEFGTLAVSAKAKGSLVAVTFAKVELIDEEQDVQLVRAQVTVTGERNKKAATLKHDGNGMFSGKVTIRRSNRGSKWIAVEFMAIDREGHLSTVTRKVRIK